MDCRVQIQGIIRYQRHRRLGPERKDLPEVPGNSLEDPCDGQHDKVFHHYPEHSDQNGSDHHHQQGWVLN